MKNRFSILEIAIGLLAIVVIVALLFTLKKENVGDVPLDAAARKVQSDIRYAHDLSTTEKGSYGVVFVAGKNYHLYKGTPGEFVIDPVIHANLVEDLAKFSGVAIVKDYQIEFDSSGNAVKGAEGFVRLVGKSQQTRDIYVVEKSGRVSVDVYE